MTDNLKFFEEKMEYILSFIQKLTLLGDFNINLKIDFTYSVRIKNLIDFLGQYQIITSETRISLNSSSLIYYLITNDKNIKHRVVEYFTVADHCDILVELSSSIVKNVNRKY